MRAGYWSLWLGISYTGSWPDTKDVSFWSSFDLNQWLRNGKHHIFFQKFVSAIKILPYFLSKRKSSGADNGVLVLWSKKGWVYVIVHYQFTTPWKKPVVFQQCCAKPCSSFPNLKLSAFGGSQELLLPKCDQWCFAFVLAWGPQNQLLLRADLTGSCCFSQVATADPSHSLCCVRQSPLAQRDVQTCQTMWLQYPWHPPQRLLVAADGGKCYSEGGNRNLRLLGEEEEKAKHLRSSSKATGTVVGGLETKQTT